MSAYTMDQVWLPLEAAHRERVYAQTFGHLAPRRNKRYKGSIVFTCGEYGDLVVVRNDLDGLDGSPWYFQAEQEFLGEHAVERGTLYRFTGYFCNYQFVGRVETLDLSTAKAA